ncbi:MAG: TlpA family protein disulfide reductase [Paracoccaceae bacterium]
MRIIVSVFVYAFIIIFANTSYTETNEIKKFYFSEDPIPINNLKVLDIDSDETNILNKNYNLLLLNFWATWCSPCTKEMPSLNELQSKFDENQFKIITIATGRNNPNKIIDFFKKYNLANLENYRDPKGKLALELGVLGLPSSIIVSRDGHDIGRLIGPIDWSKKEIENLFLELIKEQEYK